MEMTANRWAKSDEYIREVFGREDGVLVGLMDRAVAAGLPNIAVSPETGRLLMILAGMTNGGRGAKLALELGTLAGYTAIWISRGLAADGRLITVEPNPKHAAFAREAIAAAGAANRVELRERKSLEAFPEVSQEFGPASFDFIFADAIKTEYSQYFRWARNHLKPGGLFVAHNALGSAHWWIDIASTPGSEPERQAVDLFNREIAADSLFDAMVLPTHQGLMVARRKLA